MCFRPFKGFEQSVQNIKNAVGKRIAPGEGGAAVSDELRAAAERALQGNLEKEAAKLERQGKLFVRDRLALLLDEGSFVESSLIANATAGDLPADGVVTGVGTVGGRPVCVMANDSTVKAGSWGARTVEKIVRLTDQVELFPGRRGAGRIFYNQNRLSGRVPQICCLFGPSAAGGAYIPAFCDVVIMVEGNASMYLGSPRMVEMVVGERTTLEEMGGARMHASVSGSGDNLAVDDADAIAQAKAYFAYMPGSWRSDVPVYAPEAPAVPLTGDVVPPDEHVAFDMHDLLAGLLDADSLFEVKPLFAPEVIVGFGLLEGRPVGVVASNPVHKGGALFVDSADKAARFIWCCDAYGIPLVFLADVPGFMVGTEVERQGIIRHGAKMITAVSEATVPKLSVIVRKAYGAGLYAFAGPAFAPDACIALPTARIAVMGPEAAINAVYANKIAAIDDADERAALVDERRAEFAADVDLLRLASELVIDAVVEPEDLRADLVARLALAGGKDRSFSERIHGVPPV